MTTVDEEHYLRSAFLLHKGCLFITKKVLFREEQNEVKRTGRNLDNLLHDYRQKLEHEFRNYKQKEKLFPAGGKTNVEDWDISLLTGVLQTVFKKALSDEERRAVKSIKHQRNDVLAHRARAEISVDDYNDICKALKEACGHLAVGFDATIQQEYDNIVETCLNSPLDIKSHIEQLKRDSNTDDMFQKILEKVDATGKRTIHDIGEDISENRKKICKTIKETRTQITKEDVKDAVRQALQEKRCTRQIKVIDSRLEVSGIEEDQSNIDLAEQIITTMTNAAIKRTETPKELTGIRKAIEEILEEISSQTGVKVLEAEIGCVIIRCNCMTYEQLLKFLDYVDSEAIQPKLNKLAILLSRYLNLKEQPQLSLSLSQKTLQSIVIELGKDSQREYKRSIHIPIQFDSVDGMDHVVKLFQTGGLTNSLNKLSEALTAKVGTKIKVQSSINVCQVKEALEEFGTTEVENRRKTDNSGAETSLEKLPNEDSTGTTVEDKRLQTDKLGTAKSHEKVSDKVMTKCPTIRPSINVDENTEIKAGVTSGIDVNDRILDLPPRTLTKLQDILDSNPVGSDWRALAVAVEKDYDISSIKIATIDGERIYRCSSSAALLTELDARGMSIKELIKFLKQMGIQLSLSADLSYDVIEMPLNEQENQKVKKDYFKLSFVNNGIYSPYSKSHVEDICWLLCRQTDTKEQNIRAWRAFNESSSHAKGIELTLANQEMYKNVVFRLGDLHVCFNFLKSIGQHMESASLDEEPVDDAKYSLFVKARKKLLKFNHQRGMHFNYTFQEPTIKQVYGSELIYRLWIQKLSLQIQMLGKMVLKD